MGLNRNIIFVLLFIVFANCTSKAPKENGGGTDDFKADDFSFIVNNSIYAIYSVNLETLDLTQIPEGVDQEGTLNVLNGTCFFISPNHFITAHHVISSSYYPKTQYFLFNSAGNIITDIEIVSEHPGLDLTIGSVKSPVGHYLSLDSSAHFGQNQAFLAYGFSSEKQDTIRCTFRKVNGRLTIVKRASVKLEEVKCSFYSEWFDDVNSTDGIQLRNAKSLLVEPALKKGFSGGPLINAESQKVSGHNVMEMFLKNKAGDILKPLQLCVALGKIEE